MCFSAGGLSRSSLCLPLHSCVLCESFPRVWDYYFTFPALCHGKATIRFVNRISKSYSQEVRWIYLGLKTRSICLTSGGFKSYLFHQSLVEKWKTWVWLVARPDLDLRCVASGIELNSHALFRNPIHWARRLFSNRTCGLYLFLFKKKKRLWNLHLKRHNGNGPIFWQGFCLQR